MVTGIAAQRQAIATEQARPGVGWWAARHIVVKWMILSAIVPSVVPVVVVSVMGLFVDGVVASIEDVAALVYITMYYMVLTAVLRVVPGLVLGLLLGLLDCGLGRYVAARPARTGAVAVAGGVMFVSLALAISVVLHFSPALAFGPIVGSSVLEIIASCVAWALIPALVTLRRYRRISAGSRADR